MPNSHEIRENYRIFTTNTYIRNIVISPSLQKKIDARNKTRICNKENLCMLLSMISKLSKDCRKLHVIYVSVFVLYICMYIYLLYYKNQLIYKNVHGVDL
jgi:hypothetical protein